VSLSEKDVDHVARLARLEITHEERNLYQKQLNAILDHAADIAGLDLSAVPPTAHILPLSNVWRADAVQRGADPRRGPGQRPGQVQGLLQGAQDHRMTAALKVRIGIA